MTKDNIKWIRLPVKFKGIWFSPTYGGFHITLQARFTNSEPEDKLYASMLKNEKEEHGKPDHIHTPDSMLVSNKFANPTWMNETEFTKMFGQVETIIVNKKTWENTDDHYTPNTEDLLFFTDRFIVSVSEYDGFEGFDSVLRNPPSNV